MTTPRSAKKKGRDFEASTAERVRDWTGLDEDHIKLSRAAHGGVDMEMSKHAQTVWPYWTECKNHKTLNIPAWIRQVLAAQTKANDTRQPVIVFKQHGDGRKWAVVDFEHFMELSTNHLKEQ